MTCSASSEALRLWLQPVPRRIAPPVIRLPRGSALSWGIGLALLLVIEARHAAADLIDQYLPAAIAALGAAPGVTVQSRSRPDYDPLGLHVGGFVIRPAASEAVGYDSNPSALSRARGSALIDTQTSLEAASNWTRNSLGVAVTVDDRRYFSATQDNATDWTASAGGTIDVNRDQAAWSIAHLSLNQSPEQIDNGGFNRVIPYNVNDARLAYRVNFNRLSLEPGLEYATYRYAADIAGVPSQAYRNRDILTPSLTARYELAPLRNLVVVARGTLIDYLTSLPGQAKRNSDGFALLAGLEFGGGGPLETRLLAGWQQRDYQSAQYGRIAQPVVEGSITYTPSGAATFTGRLSRTIEDAADESVAGYTQTEADALVDYELRENILLHGQTTAQVANFGQGGGTTTQLGASVGASWLIRRGVTLSGTYTYLNSRSDLTNSYTDNLALLRLGLKL